MAGALQLVNSSHKTFGSKRAVDAINLDIPQGMPPTPLLWPLTVLGSPLHLKYGSGVYSSRTLAMP